LAAGHIAYIVEVGEERILNFAFAQETNDIVDIPTEVDYVDTDTFLEVVASSVVNALIDSKSTNLPSDSAVPLPKRGQSAVAFFDSLVSKVSSSTLTVDSPLYSLLSLLSHDRALLLVYPIKYVDRTKRSFVEKVGPDYRSFTGLALPWLYDVLWFAKSGARFLRSNICYDLGLYIGTHRPIRRCSTFAEIREDPMSFD